MSFWGGMARGFKDASEKKERDQAVERQQERLAIEDARYQSETERAERIRSEDVEFRMQELKTRQDQLAHDRKMAELAETRAQEAVTIDRYTKMAELIPDGLRAAYSGKDPANVPESGSEVMSEEGISTGSLVFGHKYDELSEDEKNSDLMKLIKEDKAVQAQFTAFFEAQADIGNKVTLRDFIKHHEYAGTIPGNTDSPEYQEALTMLFSGEGMDDPERYAKAFTTLKKSRYTRHVFIQTGTPSKLEDYDREMKMWERDTLIEANIAIANMPEGPIKQEIIQALSVAKDEATRYKGLVALAGKYRFGEGVLDKYNLRENSTIASLYPSGDAAGTTPGAGTGTAPGAGTDPSASSGQLTSFANPQELSDAIENGFSGRAEVGGETFIVGGQSYNVEPAGEPEGLTQGSVAPEQGAAGGVDESGFSVSNVDTSLKPVPELDALFEEVMTEGAQPKTVIPDNRPIREPQTIEEVEGGIEGALEGEALEEKVAAVEEELFDLGVYKPTNMQELEYFKEDLNVLISDLEIQIPPEVLRGVVENVIARVTYKADGPKDYSRPEAEQVEETMDWSNRRGRALGTPDDELDARARRNTGRSR